MSIRVRLARTLVAGLLLLGPAFAFAPEAGAHFPYSEEWAPYYNASWYEFISINSKGCSYRQMQGNYGTAAYAQIELYSSQCQYGDVYVTGCTGLDCPNGAIAVSDEYHEVAQSTLANKSIIHAHYERSINDTSDPYFVQQLRHTRTV